MDEGGPVPEQNADEGTELLRQSHVSLVEIRCSSARKWAWAIRIVAVLIMFFTLVGIITDIVLIAEADNLQLVLRESFDLEG